ncbi:SlyX family protein [Pseudomonas shirazensis]|uniref:SlyX family protein n=1 Tax=Pseudomonas shirazensis TaxID=2745494 RepID=UPI003D2B21D2
MSLESQIIDLETRQAFQDDALQELNDVVVEQGRVINRLQLQMAALIKRYEEMVGQYGSEGEEAPPPHY